MLFLPIIFLDVGFLVRTIWFYIYLSSAICSLIELIWRFSCLLQLAFDSSYFQFNVWWFWFFLSFLLWTHSIRLWIFPQCLNPIQHKNNTTVASEKKLFPPSLMLPFRLNACSLSFIWYRILFLSMCFVHISFYTLVMGKTPAIEQHHVEVLKTT